MIATAAKAASRDERLILGRMTWDGYEKVLAAINDSPDVRLYYLRGQLEIMTLSGEHERRKSMFRRLIEMYAFEVDIPLHGYGSTTFKNKAKDRGAEPDECYCLAPLVRWPELVIEVVWTHGGLDRLAIYAELGAPEVWFWEKGKITIHGWSARGYRERKRSRLLPGLDPALLAKYVAREDQHEAMKAFREEIRD